jgi:TetR/AcrR family transcriptional regulator, transcriptional repressor for nem operon
LAGGHGRGTRFPNCQPVRQQLLNRSVLKLILDQSVQKVNIAVSITQVGRHKQFDDTTVVRAARDVFWQRGYASTSLADLEAGTGLSRSSLYQAYGSKRGLFDHALRNYLEELVWPMVARMEAIGAGREEIVGYFLKQAANLRRSRRSVLTQGCLIANTSTELNILDAEAVELVLEYRNRVRAAIFHALSGMAESVPDRETKADILTATQIGVMISARVDPIAAAKLAEKIATDVKTW